MRVFVDIGMDMDALVDRQQCGVKVSCGDHVSCDNGQMEMSLATQRRFEVFSAQYALADGYKRVEKIFCHDGITRSPSVVAWL